MMAAVPKRQGDPVVSIRREGLVSKTIREVGYDGDSETMEVQFVSGSVYRYYDVPLLVYKQLLRASSPGRFVNTRIKPYYRFREIS